MLLAYNKDDFSKSWSWRNSCNELRFFDKLYHSTILVQELKKSTYLFDNINKQTKNCLQWEYMRRMAIIRRYVGRQNHHRTLSNRQRNCVLFFIKVINFVAHLYFHSVNHQDLDWRFEALRLYKVELESSTPLMKLDII